MSGRQPTPDALQRPAAAVIPRIALTLPEAAEAIGISARHLESLVADGIIPVVRLGGRRVIPIDVLQRTLARLASERADDPAGAGPVG